MFSLTNWMLKHPYQLIVDQINNNKYNIMHMSIDMTLIQYYSSLVIS